MSESNGAPAKTDLYARPDADLKDWYVVDALDGRRWIGKVVTHGGGTCSGLEGEIPMLPDELVLQPAFEFYPDKLAAVHPIPQPNPLNPREMQIAVQVFKSGFIEFDALLCLSKNGLPPQRVRYAGLSACTDWALARRREVARELAKSIEAHREEMPDAVRPVQSREKVR